MVPRREGARTHPVHPVHPVQSPRAFILCAAGDGCRVRRRPAERKGAIMGRCFGVGYLQHPKSCRTKLHESASI